MCDDRQNSHSAPGVPLWSSVRMGLLVSQSPSLVAARLLKDSVSVGGCCQQGGSWQWLPRGCLTWRSKRSWGCLVVGRGSALYLGRQVGLPAGLALLSAAVLLLDSLQKPFGGLSAWWSNWVSCVLCSPEFCGAHAWQGHPRCPMHCCNLLASPCCREQHHHQPAELLHAEPHHHDRHHSQCFCSTLLQEASSPIF